MDDRRHGRDLVVGRIKGHGNKASSWVVGRGGWLTGIVKLLGTGAEEAEGTWREGVAVISLCTEETHGVRGESVGREVPVGVIRMSAHYRGNASEEGKGQGTNGECGQVGVIGVAGMG